MAETLTKPTELHGRLPLAWVGVLQMPFIITCPHCYQPLTVADHMAGAMIHCPNCHRPLTAPVPPPAIPTTEEPESPFTADTPDSKRRYRPRRGGRGGKWAIMGGVIFLILVGVGLVWSGAVRLNKERWQMDSHYSDLLDLHQAYMDGAKDILEGRSHTLHPLEVAGGLVVEAKRTREVKERLIRDYRAKYGADPEYLPLKKRAQPNPMALKYDPEKPGK